ncbi:hypothetical protein AB5I39_09270 [Sphingomonas sp. MMS24-J45]|uniref:hypothetical protein n=1 Tax=Sphingomonas sp. MMS24-J45 TaxID=3238806 RepID=UPI00384F37D6
MIATHVIRVYPQKQLVDITVGGVFDVPRVIQVALDVKAAIDSLGLGPGEHLTLFDVSGFSLQSQDVVAALQSVLGDPRYTSRRLAVVADATLSPMQMQRVLKRDTAQWFNNRRVAEAWLCEGLPEQGA